MGGKRSFDRKRPDIALALEWGWTFLRRSGSGHLVFTHPHSSQKFVTSSTLGGGRGDRNAMAWIRKNTPREAPA